jgi:hypothetical protein
MVDFSFYRSARKPPISMVVGALFLNMLSLEIFTLLVSTMTILVRSFDEKNLIC